MESGDIPSVIGFVLLDGDGRRVVARYFKSHFASGTEELAFEQKLFDKTARAKSCVSFCVAVIRNAV